MNAKLSTVCRVLPVAGALLVLLSGCIVVPVPGEGRKVTADWQQRTDSLPVGIATRDDVRQKMGPPDHDFPDLRIWGYRWSAEEWGYLWAVGGAHAADGGYAKPETHRVVWLAFDEQGRLARREMKEQSLGITAWEQAARWTQGKWKRFGWFKFPAESDHGRVPSANAAAGFGLFDGEPILARGWAVIMPGVNGYDTPEVYYSGMLVLTNTTLHIVKEGASDNSSDFSVPLNRVAACRVATFLFLHRLVMRDNHGQFLSLQIMPLFGAGKQTHEAVCAFIRARSALPPVPSTPPSSSASHRVELPGAEVAASR